MNLMEITLPGYFKFWDPYQDLPVLSGGALVTGTLNNRAKCSKWGSIYEPPWKCTISSLAVMSISVIYILQQKCHSLTEDSSHDIVAHIPKMEIVLFFRYLFQSDFFTYKIFDW